MRALVVYESMFGNTRAIATAVARGLAPRIGVEVVEVGAAPSDLSDAVGLLVVGGPTHAFSMSRVQTRANAVEQGAPAADAVDVGMREWLDGLGAPAARIVAATFDTRVDRRFLPGSAARVAARRLRRMGFAVVDEVASFYVGDVPGPLEDGEEERAERWGEHLAMTYVPSPGPAVA